MINLRKHLSTLLKVSITLSGLAYVLSQAPLNEIGAALGGIQWPWLAGAFILVNVSIILRAFRWLLLLQGLGLSLPFTRLIALYFVGNFFNTFLPSGFGGDVVRVLEMGRDVPRSTAAGTVLVDRLTGLLMLFTMALLALPFRPAAFPDELVWPVTAVCMIGLAGGFFLLEPRLIKSIERKYGRWLPQQLLPTGQGPIARLWQAVQGCGPRAIFRALVVSILFNLILVGWWAAIGRSLGFTIPYSYYLLIVPILSVTLLVPSIGGLGVREMIAPLLLMAAGLSQPEAVALSLLEFALVRLSGLLGAPVYIASILEKKRDKIQFY